MKVEVEATTVDETFETVTRDYQRHASFPGFRPGKAPRDMVVKKYEKDIKDDVKKKLISDSYKKAVDEKKLDVFGYPDIEEIQFNRGQPLQFAATLETGPEFELPQYKGLPAKREALRVSDQDMDRAFQVLREQHSKFNTVDRPLQTGDVAVVNFKGTCEGKPITDLAPTAKGLTEKQGFWVDIGAQSFLPGFGDQLQGAKAGDKRTVNVDFPADFVTPQLVGKRGVYEVEVVEAKEKVLPPMDDELAKAFGAESLEKLREGVRKDLENELKFKLEKSVRNQLMGKLLSLVNFDLPATALANETRNVVYNIVAENQKRGISRDLIEKEKDRIFSAASQGAKERVKANFLIQKIAEKEDIKVSQEEIAQRIQHLAGMYQIPPDQFVKDLQKRNGLIEIYDQIMGEKVVALLEKEAVIEEVPPGSLPHLQVPQAPNPS
jgi:trigger factor